MKHSLLFFACCLFATSCPVSAQVAPIGKSEIVPGPLKSKLFKQTPAKAFSTAAVSLPQRISYQGLLTTSGGTPISDGSYDLTVGLYDSLAAGSVQWSEIHTGVPVHRGTFSIALGSVSPLSLQFTKPYFVQVTATNGPAGPSYPVTFSPRSELTSSPYSLGPWGTNGTDIYYKNGNIGIGSTAPESSGVATLKLDIADEDGNNSDISQRVSGFGWGEYHFTKSRGTLESPTIVANGDLMGGFSFLGYNGTAYQGGGGMYGFVDSVPAASAMPTRLSFYTWNQAAGWSEKMRLDRNGGLFIDGTGLNNGVLSPGLTFGSTTYSGEGIASKRTPGGNQWGLDFYTSFTPRLSITNIGYVGIGTTTPIEPLQVQASLGDYAAVFRNDDTSNAFGLLAVADNPTSTNSTRYAIAGDAWYGTNTNIAGYFYGYGGVSAYGIYALSGGATNNIGGYFAGDLIYTGSLINASDAKFKDNISDYSGALSKIMDVRARTFTFKSGSDFDRFSFSPGKHYGFVAQELEQVFPELVVTTTQPDKLDRNGAPTGETTEYKGVKTMEMIPILVQAIQEQQKLIEDLQAKVARLEQK